MLDDIGLIPVGGATVFGDFYSAVSARASARAPYVPGRSGHAHAADVDSPLLRTSPNDAQISVGPITSEKLCMDSWFVRRQP